MFDKLFDLISLSPIKGGRTKITLAIDLILYGVSLFAPQFVSPEVWLKLQPFFALIGTYFGIEHFEPKGGK